VTQPATHQPLARKYRPQTFDQLVGQETTAKALANAIQMGRTPQAVIFSGVRGVGKTTTARLYAKALNCESGPTPTPCGTCESCRAITGGNHEDVLEIDGASNTSVDDVRLLRDSIGYVPQRSKFKIYLIDEVHMLSQSAFNALLKTLEEPPAHVVFLFATTELQKIPQTILSRCQVFLLQKMTARTIVSRLEEILRQEGIPHEPGTLRPIAREARGSMRDALTLLDQAIVIGNGKLTAALCESITAQAPRELVTALLRSMVAKDARQVMTTIDRIEQTGTDLSTVIEDVAQLTRHALVLRELGRGALEVSQLDLDPGELTELETVGKSAAPFDLNRIFRTLIRCRQDMDGSALDRCILENNALEWCLDPGLPDIQQLRGTTPSAQTPLKVQAPPSAPAQVPAESAPPAQVPRQEAPVAPVFPETWAELVAMWRKHRPLHAGKLEDAHPHVYSKEVISLTVNESSYARCLLNKEEQARLKQAFSELFGFTGRIVIEKANPANATMQAPESLAQKNERETRERHDALRQNAVSHQLTRDVVEIFGGKVEDVRIKDID
jgi:DNA polymerase-3 subunit gamma/tau